MTGITTIKSVVYFHSEVADTLPLIDLYETDDSLVFEIDLPGIEPEDVLLKVYDNLVIIEGIKKERPEEKRLRYICMERNLESFRRVIKVPVPILSGEGKALYRDGVITLSFPKLREKVIRIKIVK